ncbi:MAG: domain containing CoxE-like family protein [Ramlibacter sp.]|nr:domain containing CoxE-like family protein [Ramlibacter sp.]
MLSLVESSVEALAGARLTAFPGFLRANGFAVGGGDAVQVLQAAQRVGVLDSQMLRWSLQALLCGRADEWRRFDELFDAWFLPPNRWKSPQARHADAPGLAGGCSDDAIGDQAAQDDPPMRPRDVASRLETLSSADFRTLTEREHALDVEALMRRFARRLKRIQLRREARARQRRRLDLQSTIRRSVASGGTPFNLAWKAHRRVRPRLVLLLDVSRSMALYSFFYLRLARALAGELADVHSFIFHTRVTGVSEALRDPDPWRAQERLHLIAQGWAGGTRIGESIAQFNREHAARLVNSRTAVIIMSDGYDTGEPKVLSDALGQMRRRARRIVWLNPLSKRPGYAPTCQGMQAAIAHLDLLAPGADLASIAAVLPNLIEALA